MAALPLTINGVTYYPEGQEKSDLGLVGKVKGTIEVVIGWVTWALFWSVCLFLMTTTTMYFWESLKGYYTIGYGILYNLYETWFWFVTAWLAEKLTAWFYWLPLCVQLWGMAQLSPTIAKGTDYFTWFKLCKQPFLPERAVPGSSPTSIEAPKFQFELRTMNDVKIGQGFRVELDGLDVLVTAYHNVVEEVVLTTRHGRVLVKQEDFLTIPSLDIAYIPYSIALFSVLGLSKAKSGVKGLNGVASIVDGGYGTFGVLSDNAFFGYLTYGGSTWGGCSGAPYFLGNSVFGMHLGSGGVNMGLDLSYMSAVLHHPPSNGVEIQCEGTAEYIYDSMEKGAKVEYDYSGNPDVITVRMRGKYYSVETDSDAGRKLMGKLGKQSRTRFGKMDYPEGAIPAEAMMSGNVCYSDQVAGSFLGQRNIVLRNEEPTQSTPATTTVTPVTTPSVSVGPIQAKERLETPTPSTKTSRKPSAKSQQRKNLIERLWPQWTKSNPGVSKEAFVSTMQNVSTNGLMVLFSHLLSTSTGKLASEIVA